MVVTDYQNDVIPVEDSHHLKPDIGLVRVWWDRAQKGQVDALQGRTRAQHRLVGLSARVRLRDRTGLQGQDWDHKVKKAQQQFLVDLWVAHLELASGTCPPFSWLRSKPWLRYCTSLRLNQHVAERVFCFVARKRTVRESHELSATFSANIAFPPDFLKTLLSNGHQKENEFPSESDKEPLQVHTGIY